MARPKAWGDARSLRICIAGAGAIGGTLAAHLASAGHRVSLIARGEHLRAIRANGLRFVEGDAERIIKLEASETADFGPQDVIIVAVKAHGLAELLPRLGPLCDEATLVVPALNGIPWWYFQGEGGRCDGQPVRAVDPNGDLLRAIAWTRIIGCVVYIGAEVREPGLVVAMSPPHRLVLGEPRNGISERATFLAERLSEAGIVTVTTDRIRDAIWTKLIANLSTNPLSVVTEATLDELYRTPELRDIAETTMREGRQVAAAYGVKLQSSDEEIIARGMNLGAFKTSMLQDYEKGRGLELAAIGDAVLELAANCGIAMPATRTVLALARHRAAKRSADKTSRE